MPREILISTGARLHFGLLAYGVPERREFGGVGVMIDRPGFVIAACRASADELQCGPWQIRVATWLAQWRAPGTGAGPPPLRIAIRQALPEHAGFGSGTQLGMALARICSVFTGEAEVPPEELARRAGRGGRSAVGLHGFQLGGLLFEAGKLPHEAISPLVARIDFPGEWRFVLVRPCHAAGISGTEESREFARLPPMPVSITERLCRIAETEIIPFAREHDFSKASAAIGRFGRLVGEYFAPVQGGVFADERMRLLAEHLEARQIRGVGQTSWGPTLFVLRPSAVDAEDLVGELTAEPSARDCEITIAAPLNCGATVEIQ